MVRQQCEEFVFVGDIKRSEELTEEKVKAIGNTKNVFKGNKPHEENTKIPKTRRTAATNTHPRKVIDIQDNG